MEIFIDPDSPLLSGKLTPVVTDTLPEYPFCDEPLLNINVPPVLLPELAPAETEMLPPTSPLPLAKKTSPPIVEADPVDNPRLPLEPTAAFPVRIDVFPEAVPDSTFALARDAAPLEIVAELPVFSIIEPPVPV